MNAPRDVFCDVLVQVIEGQATPEDHEMFRALLKTHPEFWAVYREQMRLHALLQCASAEGAGSPAQQREKPRVPEHRRSGWWRGAAAACVVLAVGAAATFGEKGAPPDRHSPAAVAQPIRLVRHAAAGGLELPQALPGTVRLASGLAQVRLPSGVELSLAGPLEMEAESGMEIRLTKGQLLAWVPKRASGFTVHAPGLTAWDIGTVFSVTAEPRVSRLFVFKGSVQVLDGEGEGVGLCEAGQGVLAETGRPAEVFDSDEENARRLFAKVRGDAALTDPETALAAAGLIADFWVARYAPVVVRRSAGKRPQQEEVKMNQSKTMAVIAAAAESADQSGNAVTLKRTALAALLLTAAPLAQTAAAAGFTWLPQTGSNDWNVAENWTPAGPPGSSNIADTATIPAAATGVINYAVAGSTFANLNVATTNPVALTIKISAPLVLKDGAVWGGASSQTGLYTVVTSSGSITSISSTANYIMTLNGGRFDVEAGGTMMVNRDTSVWNGWSVNGTKVTLRGAVVMPGGRTFTGTCPTSLGDNTSLTLDGGSLDTDALGLGHNCNVLFTANGGRLCTALTGGGLRMGGAGNYTYLNYLTRLAGASTNAACGRPGPANTWGGDSHTAGKGVGGTATVTLSGGTFVQRGYTAVGNGRVGNMVVSGTVFRAFNDFYVGGGDYLGTLVPNANIIVSGRVSIVSGSLSVTNAPETQSSTSVANQDGSSQNGAAQFYIAEATQLWSGQRIVFTNLTAAISGLSTGVTYYVKMFRFNSYAKCFNVAAYPRGPSLGTATGGSAQWQTFPAMLSVGNTATFSDGTRLAPGTLDLSGGSLLVDQFVATNGTRSVVRFTKGSLNVLLASDISNGVPFVAGNGADAAVLGLAGTARFADGLVVNTNATLAVGGTNAVGAVAVTGNVTLRPDAVLDVDFNAATNDCLTVDGNVTLPDDLTLTLRPMDAAYPALMPVVQVTGAGTLTGTAAGWPKVLLNGVKYKAVVSGNQLLVQKIAQGTLMSVY